MVMVEETRVAETGRDRARKPVFWAHESKNVTESTWPTDTRGVLHANRLKPKLRGSAWHRAIPRPTLASTVGTE